MPAYELFVISSTKAKNSIPFHELVGQCSKFILDKGGLMSDLTIHRKDSILPYRMKKNGMKFSSGDSWFLKMNVNPNSMLELRSFLNSHDSVLRSTICKVNQPRIMPTTGADVLKHIDREAVLRRTATVNQNTKKYGSSTI